MTGLISFPSIILSILIGIGAHWESLTVLFNHIFNPGPKSPRSMWKKFDE